MRTRFLLLVLVLVLGFAGSAAAQGDAKASTSHPRVALDTSKGRIVLELDAEKAPKTVANFLQYVKSGHYNGVIFHRVMDGFMIQTGGFTADMSQKPTKPPIKNEADNGLKNETWTVAMARTPAKDSATAQFFINLKDNDFLNHGGRDFGYAVFGRVVSGMDVVDKIAGVPTGSKGPHQDVPKTAVVIQSAKRKK